MKDFVSFLVWVGIILLIYFAVDALNTTNPNRRRRDVTDMRIIGTGLNVLGSI